MEIRQINVVLQLNRSHHLKSQNMLGHMKNNDSKYSNKHEILRIEEL